MAPFGAVLTRLRESAGFPTPFAFYRGRDGRRALGLSFPNYLKLERGQSLPQAKRLEPLLAALGLELGSPGAKELVRAYLGSLLGSERLLDVAAGAPASDPIPPSWMLAETAARQAISLRKVQLSMDQYRALAKDACAYACHVVLCNTAAWLPVKDLAKEVGRPAREVSRALAALGQAGLAETQNGKARSPLAGRFVTPPSPTPLMASIYAALKKHREAWAGRVVDSKYLILRARPEGLERYLPHLADAVNLSAIYGDVKPADDSALYLVEAKVSRVLG